MCVRYVLLFGFSFFLLGCSMNTPAIDLASQLTVTTNPNETLVPIALQTSFARQTLEAQYTLTPTLTITPMPMAVLKEAASLYEGPGNLDFPILAELPAGTHLTLVGSHGDFVKVTYILNGQIQAGFVYSKLLDQAPNNLPKLSDNKKYGTGEWLELPLGFDQPIPKNLQLISQETASDIQTIAIYPGINSTQRYSRDNNRLIEMSAEYVRVYSLSANEKLAQLDLGGGVALAISKDGSVFAVSQGEVLQVFDSYGTKIISIPLTASTGPKDCIDIAISPRGDLIAVNCGQSFDIFSIPGGETVYTWDHKSLTLHGWPIRFSPDGKKITANFEGGVGIWNVGDWSKVEVFPAGSGYFTLDDPDIIIIRGMDRWRRPTDTFQVWKISERKMVKQVDVQPDQWDFILTPLREAASNELVLPKIIDDGSIYYTYLYTPPDRNDEVWSWLFQPRFEFVTRSDGTALFVSNDYSHNGCWLDVDGQLECINGQSVIWGSNEQIYTAVSGSENGLPKIDIKTYGQGNAVATISGAFFIIKPDSIDPAHQLVFYTGFRDVNYSTPFIKNYRTDGIVKSWNENGALGLISYSKDGNYAAFFISQGPKKNLVIFDLKNSVIAYQNLFSIGTSQPQFSSDSTKLVYVTWPGRDAQPNYIDVMNVTPPRTKTRYVFDLEKGVYPFCATFSPDGSILAVGFVDGTIRFVNLADGVIIYEWQAHHESISALAFTDDGTLLASSGRSGIIKFWGILDQ